MSDLESIEIVESLHIERSVFRLAHVLFGKCMALPGDSTVRLFLYGVARILWHFLNKIASWLLGETVSGGNLQKSCFVNFTET